MQFAPDVCDPHDSLSDNPLEDYHFGRSDRSLASAKCEMGAMTSEEIETELKAADTETSRPGL